MIDMMLEVSSPSSLTWLVSELCISLVAAFGGVVVLRGLWLEGYTANEEYKDIAEMRSERARESRGRKWVFWGVAIEVLLAFGISFKDGFAIRHMELEIEKSDPSNQPITTISAVVKLVTRSGDKWPIPHGQSFGFPSLQLFWGTNLTNRAFALTSNPSENKSDWEMITILGEKPALEHIIQFRSFAMHDFGKDAGFGKPARTMQDVGAFALWLDPVPTNTDVISGAIEVTVNSSRLWTCDLPSQKSKAGFVTGRRTTNESNKVEMKIWPITYASMWDTNDVHAYDGK